MLITLRERRARLATRHGLAAPYHDIAAATDAMVCWHATENSTVYLSIGARVANVTPGDIDTALYGDRSVIKQMAMRRTIFGMPRDLLPAAIGAAGQRVAEQERRRTVRQLAAGGVESPETWLVGVEDEVVQALRGEQLTSTEIRARVPATDTRIHVSPGTKWGGEQPLAPRLFTILSAAGRVVRGDNATHWRTSRPAWSAMDTWLGGPVAPLGNEEGYRVLVERWLRRFGPGTETDLVWWLGATKNVVRRALVDLEAVEVELEDSGESGWLLGDDLESTPDPEPWAALLPVLDPTTMGWKQRDFYLGPHVKELFDRAGNGGNTAWWDGRIVGGWTQGEDGEVALQLLEDVGAEGVAALEARARELVEWLGEVRIYTYFPSPLMRATKGTGN